MRVIAGTAKGISLTSPRGEFVRPTTDRVRESIFSMLGDLVEEARVLDLFAGSGSLGIEALSRGATHVTFVEQHRPTLRHAEQNLERTNLSARAKLVAQPVEAFLESRGRMPSTPFDLVFADPPYATKEKDTDYIRLLGEHEATPSLLNPSGLLVMEVPRRQLPIESEGWELLDSRAYGSNQIWFLRPTTG